MSITDGIGGYTTADLEDARREHAERGGYLLQIGDRPASYAVCDLNGTRCKDDAFARSGKCE